MAIELSPEDVGQLRQLFLDEAAEHLGAIDQALAALASAPGDTSALGSLMRKLHTLKGSAGTVGLAAVAAQAHALEDRVTALREAEAPLTPKERVDLEREVDRLRRLLADAARPGPGRGPSSLTPGRLPTGDDETTSRRSLDSLQIRVEVDRVDELMEAVGELVMDRARIARRLLDLDGCTRDLARVRAALQGGLVDGGSPEQLREVAGELDEALLHLERSCAGLNDDAEHLRQTSQVLESGLKGVRMMEIGRLFTRFAVPIREAARRAGRQVELLPGGGQTAIDKGLVDRIAEPLLHLLRNAVAHGIEPAAERLAVGKPAAGRIDITARQRGAEIVIEVADDGRGLDLEALRAALARLRHLTREAAGELDDDELSAAIFEAGVSTREAADDLAGRGFGLDAVKEAIGVLGGTITCSSERGRGTRFVVRLPLTTAILRTLLFKVGGHVYSVAADDLVATVEIRAEDVRISAGAEHALVRGAKLPLVRLGVLLGEPAPPGPTTRRAGAILEHEGRRFVISCDKLVGPRDVVVKGLGPLLAPMSLFAGTAISGAGKVQLLFDTAALWQLAGRTWSLGARPTGALGGPRVLLADDSRSIRETAALFLLQEGYRVETVSDGWEAWELLQDRRFDLLITDGEMPRLDGYELTAAVRSHSDLHRLPVLIMTSRGVGQLESRARAAGADGFITKPLRRGPLLDAVAGALRGDELPEP